MPRALRILANVAALAALAAFGLALGRFMRDPTPGGAIALGLVLVILLTGLARLYRPGGLARGGEPREPADPDKKPTLRQEARRARAGYSEALWAQGGTGDPSAPRDVEPEVEVTPVAGLTPIVVGAPGPPPPAPDTRVDLNTATARELQQLPGIGPVAAQRIVGEREAGGPFRSVEDLGRVPGMGAAKVRVLAPLVRV